MAVSAAMREAPPAMLEIARADRHIVGAHGGQCCVGQHALAAVGEEGMTGALEAGGVDLAEAGGDDGDLDLVAEALVEHGAEDDVGVFVGGGLDVWWRLR